MIRALNGFKPQGSDVSQICSLRFLVNWALVQTRVFGCCGVDGIHVYHRQEGEKDLGLGFNQFTPTAIPTSAIQVQTIYVHTFL